jgi:hypothetical protein
VQDKEWEGGCFESRHEDLESKSLVFASRFGVFKRNLAIFHAIVAIFAGQLGTFDGNVAIFHTILAIFARQLGTFAG